MRAFVTGGTGFIGRHLVRRLRGRGDEVIALLRSAEKAEELRSLGCRLVQADVTEDRPVRAGLEGCDACFHVAGVYEVGVRASERSAMYRANVRGTEVVLERAIEAGTSRIVYVSTVNVFGNTGGRVVDEGYRRPEEGFLTYYDETKFLAHVAADQLGAGGAPVLVAMPGMVYGPGDRSPQGRVIRQAMTGRLPFVSFPDLGGTFAYVEDIVEGILLVHDRGRIGESYVLGGEIATLGRVIQLAATAAGRRPPRFTMPNLLIRLAIPLGPLVGRLMDQGPNLREIVASADGVTYWATDDRARQELGYAPRDLASGLRRTAELEGLVAR